MARKAGGRRRTSGRQSKLPLRDAKRGHEERATNCFSAFLFNITDGCRLLIGNLHLRRPTHRLPSTCRQQSGGVGICLKRRTACPNTATV